jgi:hypothetical protein
VNPPDARAKNSYARDDVRIVSPSDPSLQTKEPSFAALARAPAAKLYVPAAEFTYPPGIVANVPAAVLLKPPSITAPSPDTVL